VASSPNDVIASPLAHLAGVFAARIYSSSNQLWNFWAWRVLGSEVASFDSLKLRRIRKSKKLGTRTRYPTRRVYAERVFG
jgi:hypothetical protein